MKNWKLILPDLLAVVLFVIIAFAYFSPAVFDGKILYRHDASAGVGLGQEAKNYRQQTGKTTRWTNSAFGGMPTYQSAPSYPSTDGLSSIIKAYHLWLPENVWYLFAYLLGFYILLRAFDFRQAMAALGAVLWAFSTYFLIIIAAGHIWKVWALAYLPPLIAGIVLAYRGRYLWGLVVTALFTAFEIYANHVQMTYYYMFIILFMMAAWLVDAVRKRKMAHFLKATAVTFIGGAIGLCINLSTLYHTWQYSQESMRGKSELVKENAANQTSSGLDRDYITQWSYGIGETWTLLIPNAKGGASVPLSMNETAMKKANPDFLQVYQQLGQYWGEQPGTSGPVYVGAFVIFLFVLAVFIVKGPMKWALLAVTILSVMLSWGKNFMPLTDFFLDYMPMYAKFRTVASILVIAEFTIPLLAMMGLKKIVDEPELLAKNMKWIYTSLALTAGACLIFAAAPGTFFTFIPTAELDMLKQALPQDVVGPIVSNLTEMRQAMFTADCWRSLIIIIIGTFLLLLFKARKIKAGHMVGAIIVLCLIDLWQINKRYLNNDMFVPKSEREAAQPKTKADEMILQDKSQQGNFRVLNLSPNAFNENETSYYHKSIGGYHAAKLRRYQEMIDAYISPEMQSMSQAIPEAAGDMTKINGDSIWPVLNMLNTRYIIVPLQNSETVALQNVYAYGNAWFVDKIQYVDNANQEIETVGKLKLRHEAVADKRFEKQLGQAQQQDDTSIVTLTAYEPNHLTYDVQSGKGGIVVFSEIYYPGWTATIDGQEAELGRVDYILRAMNVSAGQHQVELMFYPKSIDTTETIAYVAIGILVLAVIFLGYVEWKRRKQ